MALKKMVLVLPMLVLALLTVMPASASEASTVCAQYHTVQRGETFYRISRNYGMTVNQLQALNSLANISKIYAGQVLCVKSEVAAPGTTTYTVAQGDTLYKIARKFGINVQVLAQANGIRNANVIYIGQVLVIPDVTS